MTTENEPSAQDVLRDVEFDYDDNEGGETGYLTVSSPEVLVKLAMLPSDMRRLADIPKTNWIERRTVEAGSCAGVPVHWYVAEDPPAAALISIGRDPETSPIGIVLTEMSCRACWDSLRASASKCRSSSLAATRRAPLDERSRAPSVVVAALLSADDLRL